MDYFEEVIFSEGITTIQGDKIPGAMDVKRIILPSTLKNIEEWAFHNCEKLEEISISEGITVIPGYAFYGCSSMKRVSLPSTLIVIEEMRLIFARHLKKLTFLKKLKEWKNFVFINAYL